MPSPAKNSLPDNRQAIVAELVRMFAVFPVQDQSQQGQDLRMEGYLEAVGDFPPWAVERARVKIIRGLVPNIDRNFAPTPAQLAEIVRELLVSNPVHAAGEGASFDGEIPTTWVLASDARWDALCSLYRSKNPERPRPVATTSKYAEGQGRFFPTAWLDEIGFVAPRPEPKMADPERVREVFGLLKGDLLRSIEESDAERKADTRAAIERGNTRAFAAACEREGLDPSSMASPALLRSLGQLVKPMPGAEEEAA